MSYILDVACKRYEQALREKAEIFMLQHDGLPNRQVAGTLNRNLGFVQLTPDVKIRKNDRLTRLVTGDTWCVRLVDPFVIDNKIVWQYAFL
jgi:hypothetical protein